MSLNDGFYDREEKNTEIDSAGSKDIETKNSDYLLSGGMVLAQKSAGASAILRSVTVIFFIMFAALLVLMISRGDVRLGFAVVFGVAIMTLLIFLNIKYTQTPRDAIIFNNKKLICCRHKSEPIIVELNNIESINVKLHYLYLSSGIFTMSLKNGETIRYYNINNCIEVKSQIYRLIGEFAEQK